MTECICGCGRPAGAGFRGLSAACYMRLYRRGGVALVDAHAQPRRPGRPRRAPLRLVDLVGALRALEGRRG